MLKRLRRFFKTLYFADIKSLPCSMRSACYEEITHINYRHIHPIYLSLFAINLFMLILDFTIIKDINSNSNASQNLIILHAIGLVGSFLILTIIPGASAKLKPHAKHLILITVLILTLLWGELIAIDTYAIYGQVITFISGMLSLACFFILNRVVRVILFFSAYLSFNFLLDPVAKLSGNIFGFWVDTSILLVLCLVVSGSGFKFFIDQYINRKIILNNIREIGRLNSDLESKVQERTEALTRANSQIELDRLRNSFFTNLYHEFRTPINVILSAQQLLDLKLKKTISDSENVSYQRNLQCIKQNSYRLMRLSSNLIDITRIDTGSYGINLKNVNIVHMVKGIVDSSSDYIKSSSVSIHFETQMTERIIAADASKIERAILNLLSNAVKFTPKNGHIFVSLYEDEDFVHICVKDSGIGIPPQMQKTIFNRFVQVDETLSRNREGSGLGLSIAKSIVELHKGNISVSSDLYNGSEFIISLPINSLSNEEPVSQYSSECPDSLDLLKIEFSDIEI